MWCYFVFLCISVVFCLLNAYIHNRNLKTETKEEKIYEPENDRTHRPWEQEHEDRA